jgi:hypothetical protein
MSDKKVFDFSGLDFDEAIKKVRCAANREIEAAPCSAKKAIEKVACAAKRAIEEMRDNSDSDNVEK